MAFLREIEQEALLETEIRMLPMPDGSNYPYQGFQIMWNTLDFLVANYKINLEWIVQLALEDAKAEGRDFDISFRNIVTYIRREADKLHTSN